MGAINFRGGSWTGGGYGYTFTPEHDEEYGRDDWFERELFEFYEAYAHQIESTLVGMVRKNDTLVTLKSDDTDEYSTFKLSDVLQSLDDNSADGALIRIEAGYHEGFQIYADEDTLRDYVYLLNTDGEEETWYADEEGVEHMFEHINGILSEDMDKYFGFLGTSWKELVKEVDKRRRHGRN